MAITATNLYIRLTKECVSDIIKVTGNRSLVVDKSALSLIVEHFLEEMLCYTVKGEEAEKELEKRALKRQLLAGLEAENLVKNALLQGERKEKAYNEG